MREMIFLEINDDELKTGENTFRRGEEWATLQIGEVIRLTKSGPLQPENFAIVQGVVCGPLALMLATHGMNNHSFLHSEGALNDGSLAWLLDYLKSCYRAELTPEEPFTVIYLDRV